LKVTQAMTERRKRRGRALDGAYVAAAFRRARSRAWTQRQVQILRRPHSGLARDDKVKQEQRPGTACCAPTQKEQPQRHAHPSHNARRMRHPERRRSGEGSSSRVNNVSEGPALRGHGMPCPYPEQPGHHVLIHGTGIRIHRKSLKTGQKGISNIRYRTALPDHVSLQQWRKRDPSVGQPSRLQDDSKNGNDAVIEKQRRELSGNV